MRNGKTSDVAKGAVAGLVAGFVASFVMNQFQQAWTKEVEGFEKGHGAQSMQPSEGDPWPHGPAEAQRDDATVKTAKAVSENILGRELREHEKEPAGTLVHYLFGVSSGGVYGALAEVTPEITAVAGIPFGAIFWVLADEVVTPLLGLAKGPTEYPLSTHAYSFASHLVYGVTTEVVRRPIRQALG